MFDVEFQAPGLLLAMPQLVDPNFRRTVVLITSHADDGAMGFVVNRPLQVALTEVLDDLSMAWKGPPSARAHLGGPVLPQSGWVLWVGAPGNPREGVVEIAPGLYLSASMDVLRELAAKPPRQFRLLLGHAGWGGGQLEGELTEGAWMVAPPDIDLVFNDDPEGMWDAAFRRLGIDPVALVPDQGVQ
jgi:putative transcriptional regulator